MDINVLKTFIAVSEHAGFSAAAEKLGYTQSTVSFQIKQLERELDTVLFDRMYHKISLTSDGETVLKYAKEILSSNEKMISDLNRSGLSDEDIEGEVRLAISSSISNRYFKENYLQFRERFPNIRLILTECGTQQMFDMLKKNETDMVFTLDDHIYGSEFEICAERQEKVHFIAASDNPLVKYSELPLDVLCEQPFILTEKDMSYRKALTSILSASSIDIEPVLEVGNPLQICSIIRGSEMITFLPDLITEDYVNSGQVSYLNVPDCKVTVWTQLMIYKNKWRSPAIEAFIDFYRNVITHK